MPARGVAASCGALVESLRAYQPCDTDESCCRAIILEFVSSHEYPFERAHLGGHLTASAVVIDSTGQNVLLGYHRKLGMWLQLGGHGEPAEVSAEAVALREATEESGIEGLAFHSAGPRPFDLDVHRIPAYRDVPEHDHLDIRFVLVAPPGATPQHLAEEHHGVRWFSWEEADKLDLDLSLRRALKKARELVAPLEFNH